MELTDETVAGVCVIRPRGRLDAITSAQLRSRIATLVDQGHDLFVLDCSGLEYVSSAGLAEILAAGKRLNGLGGRVAVAGMNDRVRRIFDISGLSPLFKTYVSVDDAVRELGSGRAGTVM